MRKTIAARACLAAALLCAFVAAGCKRDAPQNAAPTPTPEAAQSAPTPAPGNANSVDNANAEPTPARSSSPPAPAEARSAVARVYKDAVTIEAAGAAVVGDFNGDGYEDIAVAVRPVESKLAEINSDLANWIVVDPRRYSSPAPAKVAGQPAPKGTPAPDVGPARVGRRDTLLAIVHGHGREGWRDAGATQSYLLVNSAGEGLKVYPLKGYPPALRVISKGADSRADIISGNFSGARGFIYWGAGKYVFKED
jgi:hypothetical protein